MLNKFYQEELDYVNKRALYWETRIKKIADIYRKASERIQATVLAFMVEHQVVEGEFVVGALQKARARDYRRLERAIDTIKHDAQLSEQTIQRLNRYQLNGANKKDVLEEEIRIYNEGMNNELEEFMLKELETNEDRESKHLNKVLLFLLLAGGLSQLNAEQQASDIVNSINIVADMNKEEFSFNLWKNSEAMRRDLNNIIERSLTNGINPRKLIKDIDKHYMDSKQGKYVAERLLRTELAKNSALQAKGSYEKSGYDKYIFLTGDMDSCPVCTSLNETVHNVKDMGIGENMYPIHPNCQCGTAPYYEDN